MIRMKTNTNINEIISSVKKAPKKLNWLLESIMNEALEIIYRKAKENVTGGIIGGNPRLDRQEGLLSRSLKKDVQTTGNRVVGKVEIPMESEGYYPGFIQEVGYPYPIVPSHYPEIKALHFLSGGKEWIVGGTKGVPASHWLERTFYDVKDEFKSEFKRRFDESSWIFEPKRGRMIA